MQSGPEPALYNFGQITREKLSLSTTSPPRRRGCAVGETLALSHLEGRDRSGRVREATAVVAEIKLAEVAVKVRAGDVVVDAVDAALEDREVPLHGVRVDVADGVFASTMRD
jgi:hypothetical protein